MWHRIYRCIYRIVDAQGKMIEEGYHYSLNQPIHKSAIFLDPARTMYHDGSKDSEIHDYTAICMPEDYHSVTTNKGTWMLGPGDIRIDLATLYERGLKPGPDVSDR